MFISYEVFEWYLSQVANWSAMTIGNIRVAAVLDKYFGTNRKTNVSPTLLNALINELNSAAPNANTTVNEISATKLQRDFDKAHGISRLDPASIIRWSLFALAAASLLGMIYLSWWMHRHPPAWLEYGLESLTLILLVGPTVVDGLRWLFVGPKNRQGKAIIARAVITGLIVIMPVIYFLGPKALHAWRNRDLPSKAATADQSKQDPATASSAQTANAATPPPASITAPITQAPVATTQNIVPDASLSPSSAPDKPKDNKDNTVVPATFMQSQPSYLRTTCHTDMDGDTTCQDSVCGKFNVVRGGFVCGGTLYRYTGALPAPETTAVVLFAPVS